MKLWVLIISLFAVVSLTLAYPASQAEMDAEFARQVLSRAFHELSKAKRSPSIGLSLAEYMAGPQEQNSLHFIPGRK